MDNLIRALVALLIACALYWHSRALAARPHQRRAYRLAAAAILLVAALNAALAAGAQGFELQLAVGGVAMLLLLGAAISFLLAFRAGELRPDARKAAEMATQYRERRERELAERHPTPTDEEKAKGKRQKAK
jgi:hypothetical protein